MSSGAVLGLFVLFSALMGCWLAPIFLVYRLGIDCLHSFTHRRHVWRDVSLRLFHQDRSLPRWALSDDGMLFGLIIACVVNIFWANSTLEWIISIAGVLIFTGLTARDTQQVRRMAAANLEPALCRQACHNGCHEPVSRFHQPLPVPAPYSGR